MSQYLLNNACRALLVYFALFHTAGNIHAQNKKARVLFIGDSYTYTNGLPKMVADMAASTGDTLEYDMSAQTGVNFFEHIDTRITTLHSLKKLRAGGWDYVVLQEGSMASAAVQDPNFSGYYTYSFGPAKMLVDSVRRYNPCARIIFYMTWGRKNGATEACRNYPPWPYFCTYHAMDSLIRTRYIELADFNKTAVSPVGAVWRYIRNSYPGIELYRPNDSDPTLAGSYAGACSMYAAIFKKPVEGIPFNASLPADIAANIRAAVTKSVYDSLQFWRIGKYETKAAFGHQANRLQIISFTNLSVKASQYKWNFGDGQSSSAVDPMHTYQMPGSYTVRLIATGRSCSDTAYASINVADDPDAGMFVVAPNPAIDKLYITSGLFEQRQYQLQLFNSMGLLLLRQQASGAPVQSLNVSALPGGMYILSISTTKRIYHKKIIIQ